LYVVMFHFWVMGVFNCRQLGMVPPPIEAPISV
jgi:hypothetical protein